MLIEAYDPKGKNFRATRNTCAVGNLWNRMVETELHYNGASILKLPSVIEAHFVPHCLLLCKKLIFTESLFPSMCWHILDLQVVIQF